MKYWVGKQQAPFTGPDLDLLYVQISNTAPFCWKNAKLYFHAKQNRALHFLLEKVKEEM